MKILIIGGHITPALVLMDYASGKGDELVFVGTKNTRNDRKDLSRERDLVSTYNVAYEQLPETKISRHKKIGSILKLPRVLFSVWKARKMINKHKPDVMVGFGSYLSVSMGLAAKITRVPLLIHEQTTQAGLANQLVGKWARKVAISYESSRKYFLPEKTIFTGSLIRAEFYKKQLKPESLRKVPNNFIFVTGGSQGSMIINKALTSDLAKILTKVSVVHQYGNDEEISSDDLEDCNSYLAKSWFNVKETAWLMQNAKLVVCRSGGNTVAELLTVKTPAIMIPLKWAQKDEQLQNARLLSDVGAGIIIEQDELDGPRLLTKINNILNNDKYNESVSELPSTTPLKAVSELYQAALDAAHLSKE